MPLALEGVKVIETGGAFAMVNMVGGWLGDMGADVIVVEPPHNRAQGSDWSKGDRFRPETNRNKRMIGLDLKKAEGREVHLKLAKEADVLIEANRPGVAKSLGYDYETLSAINPRIIVASLTGYGQKGPYARFPGHGLVWEATAGWLLTQGQGFANTGGDYTGKPWINYFNLPDMKAAPDFFAAILAALYAREKFGVGQYIDMAVFDGVITARRAGVPPTEAPFLRSGPGWNVYECKDSRYIAVAAVEPLQWSNLCQGLGVPEFGNDPAGRENLQGRHSLSKRAEEIQATFERIFKTRTRDEWFTHLNQWDTEVARVNTMDEAAQDPQVKLRGMHVEVVGDDGYREVQYGTPWKLSKTPGRSVYRRAPRLGEDTDQILKDLGYTQEAIASLRKANAVM